MKKTEFEFQYLGNCLLCDRAFTARSALRVGKYEDLSQVYAQCGECKSSFFIYIIKGRKSINVIPVITDLSKNDLAHLPDMAPITEAEVKALDAS